MCARSSEASVPAAAPVLRDEDKAGGAGCGLLILRLGRISAFRLGAALAALEMRSHEFAVLSGLADAGPMSQGELGQSVRVHSSNLVALLDGLEADGLVARERDSQDRRRYMLRLTAAGRRRLERARHAALAAEQELLEPLSEVERERLHSYLSRMAAHACGGGSC